MYHAPGIDKVVPVVTVTMARVYPSMVQRDVRIAVVRVVLTNDLTCGHFGMCYQTPVLNRGPSLVTRRAHGVPDGRVICEVVVERNSAARSIENRSREVIVQIGEVDGVKRTAAK